MSRAHVYFMRSEGGNWEPWHDDMSPKPPKESDAPFHKAEKRRAQWPNTGVHFYAIRFGRRVWDAVSGWRQRSEQDGDGKCKR